MPRALVLLSGGLDSAVALWWALRGGLAVPAGPRDARAEDNRDATRPAGRVVDEVVPLSYRYKGRPAREARAARSIVEHAGLRLREADLPFLAEPSDAELHPASRLHRAPRGYIPARNAVFYASAAFHAETLACDAIVGGHNADDAARFPDASRAFFERFEAIVDDGLWAPPGSRGPRLVMPLLALTKLQVVALGRELRVPMALAWSCYEDGEAPCGVCPSCTERQGAALAEVG